MSDIHVQCTVYMQQNYKNFMYIHCTCKFDRLNGDGSLQYVVWNVKGDHLTKKNILRYMYTCSARYTITKWLKNAVFTHFYNTIIMLYMYLLMITCTCTLYSFF